MSIIRSITEFLNPSLFGIQKYVCPIYGADDIREPYVVGSGVLLEIGDEHFLITAAHVLDENKNTTLYFAGNHSVIELQAEESERTKDPLSGRKDDKYDIAFLKLSDFYFQQSQRFNYLSMQSVDLNNIANEKNFYCYIGFPSSKTKVIYNTHKIRSGMYSYSDHSVIKTIYDTMGMVPKTHTIIPFDKRKVKHSDGQIQTFPDPWGMSGGGVWRIMDLSNNLNFNSFTPMLIGIALEWHDDRKILVSVNIAFVFEALKRTYPHLSEYIPDCSIL